MGGLDELRKLPTKHSMYYYAYIYIDNIRIYLYDVCIYICIYHTIHTSSCHDGMMVLAESKKHKGRRSI